MFFRIFILIIFPSLSFSQSDTLLKKTFKTKAVKNVFKNASDIEIDPAAYMELANSGLYTISYSYINDTTLVYKLDSTLLLRSIGYKINLPALKDVYGKKYKFRKNKITVINFWSTTCKPCLEEMDMLNLTKVQFKDVSFIAITPDSVDEVKAFLQRKKFNYTILFLSKEQIHTMNVENYPTHFIIDKNGYLRWTYIGKALFLAQRIKEYQ